MFVEATSHPAPNVDLQTWNGYGLIHPYDRAQKYIWKNNQPPAGREQHPVVMVAYEDAQAYAQWLSEVSGENWRLPTEAEWEKSVRGIDGRQTPGANRAWVKGGSWDDSGCGVCRPAARHSRPKPIKHILIGFRLVKTQ